MAQRVGIPGRVLAAVVMAVLLVAGIFVFGRISDDENLAKVLTVAWFGAMFAAWVLLGLRRRELALPLGVGFVVVSALAFVFVALPSVRGKTVDERVAVGTPRAQAPARGDARPRGNVELARGSFSPVAHGGSGDAAVVRLAEGGRVLTLTSFSTASGPDLRVYLATGDPAGGGELGDFEDLGGLKGNKGNQQYEIPGGLDLDRYSTVVVWCRAFSVPFTSAPLERS
jgi:Electron transfer DM13